MKSDHEDKIMMTFLMITVKYGCHSSLFCLSQCMVITQLATPNLSQIFRTAISYNIHSIKCELSPRLYVNLLRLLKLLLRLLTALVFYFYIKRFILAKITHEIKLGFIDLPLLHVLGCPFHLFITSHVIMFIFRIFQASLHHNGVFIYRRYACFS